MPLIDIMAIEPKRGSDYPKQFDQPLNGREALNVAATAAARDLNANHLI